MDQLVVGGAQHRVAGAGPEAAAVDQRLRMLDAEADRERLGFDVDAAVVQHLERVARAVADRQHDVVGFAAARRWPACTPRIRPSSISMSATRLSKRISPPSASMVARIVSTMLTRRKVPMCGLADVEDLVRRAGLDELGQHLAAVVLRVLDLAVELAVGEGAGAAFAELHVGLRVQHALAPEAERVLGALAHDLAALEDDRAEAHLRQDQAGEQAARPDADDDRTVGKTGRRMR